MSNVTGSDGTNLSRSGIAVALRGKLTAAYGALVPEGKSAALFFHRQWINYSVAYVETQCGRRIGKQPETISDLKIREILSGSTRFQSEIDALDRTAVESGSFMLAQIQAAQNQNRNNVANAIVGAAFQSMFGGSSGTSENHDDGSTALRQRKQEEDRNNQEAADNAQRDAEAAEQSDRLRSNRFFDHDTGGSTYGVDP